MSEQHLLEVAVNKIADEMNEQAPDVVVLPREEMIRFVRSQFYVGAAVMLSALCSAVINDRDMTGFMDYCSRHIVSQENMTLDQIIATMKAHQSG